MEPFSDDLTAWIAQGIRQLEDLLLVHAAFQALYPEQNTLPDPSNPDIT